MDAAVLARAAQYAAVAIVGGSSLMLARTPGASWPRRLTAGAALLGAAAVAAWLVAQAQEIAGDAAQWASIALDTGFGHVAVVRGVVLLVAGGLALAPRPATAAWRPPPSPGPATAGRTTGRPAWSIWAPTSSTCWRR